MEDTILVDSDIESGSNSDTNTPAEFSSSAMTPIAGPNSTRRVQKRRRQRADAIWSYARALNLAFEPTREGGRKLWYCKYPECAEYYCKSTNAARWHMLHTHEIEVIEKGEVSKIKKACQSDIRELYKKQELQKQDTAEQTVRNTLKAAAEPIRIKEALLRLIILHDLPFNTVEWPQFHTFIHTINYMAGGTVWTSHQSVANAIQRNFDIKQSAVKETLRQARSRIHLCTDTWHSPNHKELQAITAHFVDQTGGLRKALLDVHDMPRGHSSKEIAPAVLQSLDRYDIRSKLGYITMDNAVENDLLCERLSKELNNWDPVEHRLRCLGHIINLAVQSFLFAKSQIALEAAIELSQEEQDAVLEYSAEAGWVSQEPLQKILSFTNATRASDKLYNEFKNLCGQRTIHKPNETRWNSYFDCFGSALNLQLQYNIFVQSHDNLSHLELTIADWRLVKDTCDFLRPFNELVLKAEGDYVTLNIMQTSMDFIVRHILDSKKTYEYAPAMTTAINTAWFAFDKYYSLIDRTSAYAAALLLHPGHRKAYIDAVWKPQWIRNGLGRAKELWIQYNVDGSGAAEDQIVEEAPSAYERWLVEMKQKQKNKLQDEYTRFINASQEDVGMPPLQWWQEPAQQSAYPRLAKMAVDLLSVPAMSAEAERVFSHGRRLIPYTRNALAAVTVNQVLCLKHWLSTGIISDELWLD